MYIRKNKNTKHSIILYNKIILYIYQPLACHSYNIIKKGNKNVKIATIDTLLSFYLAFLSNPLDLEHMMLNHE